MKDINFPHHKKVDLFKVKKQLPIQKPPQQNQIPVLKLKPKSRSFEEIQLERKLAKAGFKGFY